ncbi:MAG: hypothetical protein JXQ23_13790 [Clostridia bacterium]|nr:hypothetical protein [Clostridia bacterium]
MDKIKFKQVGKNDCDSFPLGNGDIGINVWAKENNTISMYISKTDSFSSALELLKIGKADIQLVADAPLKFQYYSLDTEAGICKIKYDIAEAIIFVDMNHPCIRIHVSSKEKIKVKVTNEIWRTHEKLVDGDWTSRKVEYGRTAGQDNIEEKIITYPDKQVEDYDDCIMWYHQNPDSHYENNLRHQEILAYKNLYDDPLLYRTFGACIMNHNREKKGKTHDICIGVLTEIIKNEKKFIKNLYRLTKKCVELSYEKCLKDHKKVWKELTDKSFIHVKGDEKASLVNSGYHLQRYMNICAGKGEFPIKFNGSIFTFSIPNHGQVFDPDYRMWGGCYWFQNTRLIYWSMMNAGDFEQMKPFFEMYEKAYDIVKAKTKEYYGIDGLLYPETMTPWGTHRNVDFGFKREGVPKGESTNMYLRFYHSGMLELVTMMIEYYHFTKDEKFKDDVLLKHAKGVLDFYFQRYQEKDENGKIVIYPSQALENWQDAKNPTDAVAGLQHVLNELGKLEIKNDLIRKSFEEYREMVPDIPMFMSGGRPDIYNLAMIKPALYYDKLGNVENPELYAVFPYRLFSFEKENVGIGRETFRRRSIRNYFGWTQDGIQAATLAIPQSARDFVEAKFCKWNDLAKFQAFWGPNFDWVPDQDHGASASIALQKMLIQCVDEKIYLFAGWPKEWDVTFKLFAYDNTVVEGELKNGEVINIKTTPENRINDIVIAFDKQHHSW